MGVRLICDSACDMTLDEAKDLNVTILPIRVRIDGREYLDGVNLSMEAFFNKLEASKKFPTTRPITVDTFNEALQPALDAGDEVVIITITGTMSETARNAAAAAEPYAERVWVVDSGSLSIGENILLRYAIRLRDRRLTGRQIAAELDRAKVHIRLMMRLNSLEYLWRGGRVSRLKWLLGKMIGYKPLLLMENGEIRMLGNSRTLEHSDAMLKKVAEEAGGIDFSMPVMSGYSGLDDSFLREHIRDSRDLWDGQMSKAIITMLHCTVSSHAGPGAVGIAFFSWKYRLYHW